MFPPAQEARPFLSPGNTTALLPALLSVATTQEARFLHQDPPAAPRRRHPGCSCGDNGGRGHTAVRAGGCGKRVKNGTSTQTQLRAGPDLASILPLPLGRWAPSKGASRGAWSALCPEKPVDTVPWAQRSLPCRTEVTVRLHRPSSRGSTGSQPGLRGRPARSGLVRPLTTPRARSLPDLAPAASGSPEVLRSSRVPINTDQGPGSAAGLLLAPRWAAHNTPHPWAWPGFSQTQGRCPRKRHGVPGPAHRRKGGTAGNSSVFPGVLALKGHRDRALPRREGQTAAPRKHVALGTPPPPGPQDADPSPAWRSLPSLPPHPPSAPHFRAVNSAIWWLKGTFQNPGPSQSAFF